MNDGPTMTATTDAGEALATRRRLRPRIARTLATLAMGSWVIVAAIPMVVAIVALT